MGKIAEAEKIKVEQEDLSQLLYQQAMQTGVQIDKLVQELKKDQERLNSLRQSALFNKTIQFLVDNAKVTEKCRLTNRVELVRKPIESIFVSYAPLPYVYERDGRTERTWDIYSRLLKDRIVFIGTPINDFVANSVIAQLLFLQTEDPKKDIYLYINSPGGSVTDGMAIYDTMNLVSCNIVTILRWACCQHEYGAAGCRNSW